MNMMKALIPSVILTLIVSAIVGLAGSEQGFLNLWEARIGGYPVHWSWTLFFVAMALNGGLVLAMARPEQPRDDEEMAPQP